jgi:hypothetical protein
VCLHGVLDGKGVQAKLARDVAELVLGRAVQADPRDSDTASAGRVQLG